jgi:hypothetical protein
MDVAKLAEATEAQKSYQANLYDVNTAALQVLRDQLATGNVTVDAINQQKAVLELIGQKITDSATLTTTAIRDSSGRVVTGLQDPNGRIVATFDDGQAKVVDVTDLVAEATRGSESLLNAMLTKLGASSSESSAITGAISNGNADVFRTPLGRFFDFAIPAAEAGAANMVVPASAPATASARIFRAIMLPPVSMRAPTNAQMRQRLAAAGLRCAEPFGAKCNHPAFPFGEAGRH